jgi:hypothetical protein
MRIVSGRDVGSAGVFERVAEGRILTFRADGARLVDVGTGTEWDLTGSAVAGPLVETQLPSVPHLDTFCFAWSA